MDTLYFKLKRLVSPWAKKKIDKKTKYINLILFNLIDTNTKPMSNRL